LFKIITALCILLLFISNSKAEVSKEKKKVKATWYQCCNKHTASGDVFNPINCNIAHRFLPFGTNVRLTNPDNGSFVDTTVNDRGPYVKGIDIDVTKGCAIELGFFRSGKTKLILEIINDNK
jgi:rare lipoprotein A